MAQEYFRTIIRNILPNHLSEHEIITLARYYGQQKLSDISPECLAARAQQVLKEANFKDFNKLHELCLQRDRERFVFFSYPYTMSKSSNQGSKFYNCNCTLLHLFTTINRPGLFVCSLK